jgi:gliding motility-associated-like protein
MIKGSGFDIRKIVLYLLFLAGIVVSAYSQEKSIGGVINEYSHVVSIGTGVNVPLADVSIFEPYDTVLLIQMKGVVIAIEESGSYGGWHATIGSPGSYEFLIIQSVNTSTGNIIFTSDIKNSYDVDGVVQLIKLPQIDDARVSSELTCQPWDSVSKKGGVLAMIVGGTLTLDANINVSGKGFMGGTPFAGQGICVEDNSVLYDKQVYPESFLNAGYKGESPAIRGNLGLGNWPPLLPEYAKGQGRNLSGGGGGNGRFSGGGGGASIGIGGTGGKESPLCTLLPRYGGIGGLPLSSASLDGYILLGSGGGSSTYGSGGAASPGGRGGGIIIIVCDTLKGNGKIISANGSQPALFSSGNAGSGGGGGGGTVALYQRSFSSETATSALTISANGGNGGNANNTYGDGGGGGGGLVLTNNLTFPANVTRSFTGGARGTKTPSGSTSNPGGTGESLTTFMPLLNGFLFNSVRSSVSNNMIDSVCSNTKPPKIIGTNPVGGSEPYTYIWQKSYESTFASPVILTNDIDPLNYTPKLADASTPTDAVWFRRIVISSGSPVITDISKAVKIIVHPAIQNYNVGSDYSVCPKGNPPEITQLPPAIIIPKNYSFITWKDSTLSGTWNTIFGANGMNYDPPALLTTTWYRREVSSGSCVAISGEVKMTVLPAILNNSILSAPQDICYGTTFINLTATTTATTPALGGGDNSYRFKWMSNINTGGWITAAGTSNQSAYNPVEQAERIPSNEYDFKRIVFSGNDDVCQDTSDVIHLRDYPHITGNTLTSGNQAICSGTAPVSISGSAPSGGSGTYVYLWEQSTDGGVSWGSTTGVNTQAAYQPPVLTVTTRFRRSVISSPCTSVSNSIIITVTPQISNNNISLTGGGSEGTTICQSQTPPRFIGTSVSGGSGTYLYSWEQSTDGGTTWTAASGANTLAAYQAPALTVTTRYRRMVISTPCTDPGNTLNITVLPQIANNAISSAQTAVCANTAPGLITGSSPTGGSGSYTYLWEQSLNGGSIWSVATGTNTSINYQPPVLSAPVRYRRKVASGSGNCCTSTSDVLILSINPEPQSTVYAGADASIYSLEKNYTMNATAPNVTGETGLWTVSEPMTAVIDNLSDGKAEVTNLSTGSNLFIWTISNGLCTLDDSVYIDLLTDFIPQGFSPNGDGWNNTFIIEGLNLSDQQIAELTILNGAGMVVYATSNRDGQEWADWDGKNQKGNDLPEGTYYYLLKIITQEKKVIKKSGFIVLKRY